MRSIRKVISTLLVFLLAQGAVVPTFATSPFDASVITTMLAINDLSTSAVVLAASGATVKFSIGVGGIQWPSSQSYTINMPLPAGFVADHITPTSVDCPNANLVQQDSAGLVYTFSWADVGGGEMCNVIFDAYYTTDGLWTGSGDIAYTITDGNGVVFDPSQNPTDYQQNVNLTFTADKTLDAAATKDRNGDGRIDGVDLTFSEDFLESDFVISKLSIGSLTNGSWLTLSGDTVAKVLQVNFADGALGAGTNLNPGVSLTAFPGFAAKGSFSASDGANPALMTAVTGVETADLTAASGATMYTDDDIEFQFSESMDAPTLTGSFRFTDSVGTPISGAVSVGNSDKSLFFSPVSLLTEWETYHAYFSSGSQATDYNTNPLAPRDISLLASGTNPNITTGLLMNGTGAVTNTGILIDNGVPYTSNSVVRLDFSADHALSMCYDSSDVGTGTGCTSGWKSYVDHISNHILSGTGTHTIYVKYSGKANGSAKISDVYSATIIVDNSIPALPTVTPLASDGPFAVAPDVTITAATGSTIEYYYAGGPFDGGTSITLTGVTGMLTYRGKSPSGIFGDTGSGEYVIDTSIPTVSLTGATIIGSGSSVVLNFSGSKPTLKGHADDIYSVYVNGTGGTAITSGTGYISGTNTNITLHTADFSIEGDNIVTVLVSDGTYTGSANLTIKKDTVSPVITLLWSTPITIAHGSTYTDSGATALDTVDGDITNHILTWGTFSGTSSVGSFTITYDVADAAGNQASQVTRTIHVTDQTNPTVSLLGSGAVSIELGSVYTDSGASWTDNVDGTGMIATASSGTVNTGLLWTYTLDYTYIDAAGNPGNTVSRTVTVIDTTNPVVTLNGSSSINVEFGTPYTELGATWSDIGNGTWVVSTISGSVNTGALGTYTLTYTKVDPSGNTGSTTRTVNVIDTTAPAVTLNGSGTVNIEFSNNYTELGATWSDAVDGTGLIVAASSGLVNTGSLGNYTLSYSYADSSWNTGSVSRVVHVIDTTAPTVSLNGSGTINIERGTTYTELWATWSDPGYGTGAVSTISGSVNVTTPGTYSLTYLQVDPSGNTGSTTRNVIVADSIAPNISALTSTGITSSSGSMSFLSNETGTGYYVVILSGAVAPMATDILAGLDGSGGVAIASGSLVTASGANNFVISGLSPSTAYDVYVTVSDLFGNLQVTPLVTNIVTTTATDSIPDAFTFTPKTGADLNTQYTASMTVSGTDTGSLVSITGGEYQIGTGSFVTSTGTVQSGDMITVRGFSSPSYSTSTFVILTISGVSGTFTITTKWAPSSGGGGGGGWSYSPPAKDYCPNGDFSMSLYDGNCGIITASGATNSGSISPVTSPNPWLPSTLSPLVARFVSRVTDPVRGISLFRTNDMSISARMSVVESKALNKLNALMAERKITSADYQEAIVGYNQFVLYLTVYRETGSMLAKSRALAGYETFIRFYRR